MRTTRSERKRYRPKSSSMLSEKEARERLKVAERLYVLGINSAHVEQTRKAVEAKFGISPEIVIGEPTNNPALCVKVGLIRRRITDTRMEFSIV